MNLTHYASSPLAITPKSVQQKTGADYKPRGLWVSVNGPEDWRWWCEAENFNLESLGYEHNVVLRPDVNLLHLNGAQALDKFSKRYCAELYPGQSCREHTKRNPHRFLGINWEAVAKEHQGIIIAPYCWERRMDLMWYYGWDCASGCIWDARAVQSITCQTKARSAA